MFKNIQWGYYAKYGLIAAIAYLVPLSIFIKLSSFTQSWLLYIGNFAFMIVVAAFHLVFNKNRRENASSTASFLAGHIVTMLGTLMATLLSLLLLVILVPGLLEYGTPDKVLTESPDNNILDRTNGLVPMILLSVTVCNFGVGSFIALLFPFTLKADQTKEKVSPSQSEY
ncbi:MAG: hypothetical protein H7Y03_02850 [Chitinophagaceae bacterium]|nr:hypothetical protein [Chitinophagaceae bacterium]